MQTEYTYRPGLPAPEALINRARWLRDENLSFQQIAEATGLSQSTVGKYLKGEGEAIFQIVCEGCGDTVERFKSNARWCSDKCKERARYGRAPQTVEIVCAWCGDTATRDRPWARFCGRSCQQKDYYYRVGHKRKRRTTAEDKVKHREYMRQWREQRAA